jgi:hypothetical protein
MRIVRIIALSTLVATISCKSTKKVAAATPVTPQIQQVEAVNTKAEVAQPRTAPLQRDNNVGKNNFAQPAMFGVDNDKNNLQEPKTETISQPETTAENPASDYDKMAAGIENKQNENIQSFAQVKQMAASKQLNLSSKQLKRLDKLDKKYHGDFNKFKSDAGGLFDTQTSKIIAAVGVLGLLLLIISGSGFGAFILILSVGALLLKWLGIVSF